MAISLSMRWDHKLCGPPIDMAIQDPSRLALLSLERMAEQISALVLKREGNLELWTSD